MDDQNEADKPKQQDAASDALRKLFAETQPSVSMGGARRQCNRLRMGAYSPTPEEVAKALGVQQS